MQWRWPSVITVEGLTRAAALEAAAFRCAGQRRRTWPDRGRHAGPVRRQRRGEDRIARQCPLRRAGSPEEIAQAIVYAASDAAAFMTGHILAVDCGMTVQ